MPDQVVLDADTQDAVQAVLKFLGTGLGIVVVLAVVGVALLMFVRGVLNAPGSVLGTFVVVGGVVAVIGMAATPNTQKAVVIGAVVGGIAAVFAAWSNE